MSPSSRPSWFQVSARLRLAQALRQLIGAQKRGPRAARELIATVAKDGETARIVPERDSAALAGAIDDLLRDKEQSKRLGMAARKSVQSTHTWERVAARFDDIYRRVTGADR